MAVPDMCDNWRCMESSLVSSSLLSCEILKEGLCHVHDRGAHFYKMTGVWEWALSLPPSLPPSQLYLNLFSNSSNSDTSRMGSYYTMLENHVLFTCGTCILCIPLQSPNSSLYCLQYCKWRVGRPAAPHHLDIRIDACVAVDRWVAVGTLSVIRLHE